MDTITWQDFERVELRVGRVLSAEAFPQSECLVTGFQDESGGVVLCVPDRAVPLGAKLL